MIKNRNAETAQLIQSAINQHINTIDLEVIDQSHLHKHHKEAIKNPEKGHFHVIIQFEDSNNMNRVQQHRAIYQAISPIMERIHAISIAVTSKN